MLDSHLSLVPADAGPEPKMGHPNSSGRRSDFGVEVEEGVDAEAELGLDLFAAALEHVHGDVSLVAVLEGDGRVADCRDFIGGQQPHSVDKREICHTLIVAPIEGVHLFALPGIYT